MSTAVRVFLLINILRCSTTAVYDGKADVYSITAVFFMWRVNNGELTSPSTFNISKTSRTRRCERFRSRKCSIPAQLLLHLSVLWQTLLPSVAYHVPQALRVPINLDIYTHTQGCWWSCDLSARRENVMLVTNTKKGWDGEHTCSYTHKQEKAL